MSRPAEGNGLRIMWVYARGASGTSGELVWCVEPRGEEWVARACTTGREEPLITVGAEVERGPGGEWIVATAGGELRAVVGGGESAAAWYATSTLWAALGVPGGCYEAPSAEITRAQVGQPR
ncbi:MAG: hypothetical protein DYG92_12815 [Leptolyngbya sp. PLA1]|nr:hypothetical protein [Leptolyngbya sp. PLA1]